jgi:Ion channel
MTSKSPKFYGWTYILLIPFFAIIYYILPNESFNTSLDKDSYLTYLYYSTVTITTLGYGDISPKTSISQVLVILETIAGVITIGLFLNSLSIKKSKEISEIEKEKSKKDEYKREYEKLIRHSKIIEQNIEFYLLYLYEVTTPIDIRDGEEVNYDFKFNDLTSLFYPSMRMTDDFAQPAIKHYYLHQNNLENSIRDLLLDINFSYWTDLEQNCIDFLKNCKTYDFSSNILSQVNLNFGDKKMTTHLSEYIKSFNEEVEFKPSHIKNPYVALFKLIKLNLKFVDFYQKKIEEIKNK